MLRDTLVGLIEPRLRGAGVHGSRAGFSPCCSRHRTIDPQCLENPRPAGAESTLTENARSPFHAEPRQTVMLTLLKTFNLRTVSSSGEGSQFTDSWRGLRLRELPTTSQDLWTRTI